MPTRPKEGSDSAIGMFLQADSFTTTETAYGLNRYMYTNGNPIKYVDPTGHYNAKNFAQDAIIYMTYNAISNSNSLTEKYALLSYGTKFKYNFRNEKGTSFWRSDAGKFLNISSPLNQIGFAYAATNYVIGRILAPITRKNPEIRKVKGGYVVTNGPLSLGGISLGHFAVINDDSEATIRHEAAHIQQYNEWGRDTYCDRLCISPINNLFRRKTWGEGDADKRAGTWNYSQGNVQNLVNITTIIFFSALISARNNPTDQNIECSNQKRTDFLMATILQGLGYVP